MRNFFAGLGSGSGALVAAVLCAVLLAAGLYVQSGREDIGAPAVAALVSPSEKPAPAIAVPTPSKPDSDDASADPVAGAALEPEAAAEPSPAKIEPDAPDAALAFDEVRRDADGVTVIAGRAAPGAVVNVLQNGTVIASAKADGAGKFATLAMIAPDGQGHVLSLLEKIDGFERNSESEIILAPTVPSPSAAIATAQPDAAAPAGNDAGGEVALAAVSGNVETGGSTDAVGGIIDKVEGATAATAEPEPAASPTATGSTASPTPGNKVPAQSAATTEKDLTEAVTALGDPDQAETPKAVAQGGANPATSAEENATVPPKVAVLKSTATGVELLNTEQPEAMTNVALDTISYSEVGEVQLAGRAQTNTASVRVYLDNNSLANLPVDAQGRWRGELPDVDEGIYTLRVDEVSAGGKVTSRVETPFKREATEVLLAAAAEQDGPISAITVQEGATLWAIARERYGDGALYVRVFEANTNAIRDPDLIYPGQVFDLPD